MAWMSKFLLFVVCMTYCDLHSGKRLAGRGVHRPLNRLWVTAHADGQLHSLSYSFSIYLYFAVLASYVHNFVCVLCLLTHFCTTPIFSGCATDYFNTHWFLIASIVITDYVISLRPGPLRLLRKYHPVIGPSHTSWAHVVPGARGVLQDLPQISGHAFCKVLFVLLGGT